MFAANAPDPGGVPPVPDLRRELRGGFAIIGAFVLGLAVWGTLAPLESAAIAPGSITVDGARKTVQHLEGGIVREILVGEGETVSAGQILLRLDETTAEATQELLRSRWLVASALTARLTAERDGLDDIPFPPDLLAQAADPKVQEVIQSQRDVLAAHRQSLAGQRSILEQRIEEDGSEIAGLQGQIRAEEGELALLQEELADVRQLYEKGYARKPRVLELERAVTEVNGRRSLHLSQIARARQSINETRLRVADLENAARNGAVEELRRTQAELYDLAERLRASDDVLARSAVRAPLAGTVVGLKVHTAGGVIAPGAPLMDIVPAKPHLVVEAKVAPRDIDVVHRDLTAQVRLTAFNQRHSLPLLGRVVSVSADRLTDEASGQPYYLARIELEPQAADGEPIAAKLHPGMQAEVLIVTGSRSALAYLVEPFTRSFGRAFREN